MPYKHRSTSTELSFYAIVELQRMLLLLLWLLMLMLPLLLMYAVTVVSWIYRQACMTVTRSSRSSSSSTICDATLRLLLLLVLARTCGVACMMMPMQQHCSKTANVTWQFCFPVMSDVCDVTLRDVMCYVKAFYLHKSTNSPQTFTLNTIYPHTNKLQYIVSTPTHAWNEILHIHINCTTSTKYGNTFSCKCLFWCLTVVS